MRRGLLSLLIVPLLAGCGDDGTAAGTGPAATTSGEATTTVAADAAADAPSDPPSDTTCADLDVVVLDQVEDPGPADTRPEGAPPTAEEVQEGEAAAAALRRLAEGGPDELRDAATTIAAAYEIALQDPEAVTDEEWAAVDEGRQQLLDWGVESCDGPGPIWSCAGRRTFRLVGGAIGSGPEDREADLTPEDAVRSVDIDPAWEMVEVERTDDRVTFAWLDDGLAVRSATAAVGAGGDWSSDQTTSCDTGDRLPAPDAPIDTSVPPPGQPADDDELPPASSTSVP